MFDGFANLWTPLIQTSRIGGAPVRVLLAGEPLVLFRAGGGISALVDRCPHRGAALSLGKVGADGCLECPYHGWRFDAEGRNRNVPFNPQARLDRLGATPVPTRQIGELVWVYTAPGTGAPIEPIAAEGLSRPGLSRVYLERIWRCHWTRAMENMLDSPHLPYVHRRTIGAPIRRRMSPGSSMSVSWEETTWGGRTMATVDAEQSPALLEFFRPNMMTLNIPMGTRHLNVHALVIPMDRERTRLIVAASRDFARTRLVDPIFRWMNGRIADEDKAVVESAGTAEIPPPGEEPSVATDRATLQFRRYHHETLRSSTATAAPAR